MKKLIGFSLICVMFIFGSCVTTEMLQGMLIVFDESVPLERSATIAFYSGVEVTEYNGIPVPHKKSFGNTKSEWKYVAIPAGVANFTVDVLHASGNTIWKGSNFIFRYNFRPGLEYVILVAYKEREWGVDIYQQSVPSFGTPDRENLLDFVLFINQ
ncbi:MAG: hypothetical protein FWD47_00510 [Treponema sp.]|nr:hypothetical protein [Treponema sp.]